MPKMKPGKDQGNIDKKALPKQIGTWTGQIWDQDFMQDPFGLNALSGLTQNTDFRGHITPDAIHDFGTGGNSSFGKLDADSVISSGGDSGGDNKDIVTKINDKEKPTSLYGSGRFNQLWSLYNKVKDKPGIENDPRYHRLIKKISRKMPRTLKNLKTKMDKATEMRQKISNELGNNITVTSSEENYKAAVARGNEFLADPYHKPIVRDDQLENKDKKDIGTEQTNNRYSARNLGSRLGTDISAALKNKKW